MGAAACLKERARAEGRLRGEERVVQGGQLLAEAVGGAIPIPDARPDSSGVNPGPTQFPYSETQI